MADSDSLIRLFGRMVDTRLTTDYHEVRTSGCGDKGLTSIEEETTEPVNAMQRSSLWQ